jgi:hypothetical protein
MLAATATFALLLIFSLVAWLEAPAASASVPRVSNLVIRSITVDPQTKVATVKGAVTCTDAKRATVFVDVSQTVGRFHTVRASGDKDVRCDGRVRFTLKLTNFEGRLGPGDATVDALAITCTPHRCFGADFNKVVRITNA